MEAKERKDGLDLGAAMAELDVERLRDLLEAGANASAKDPSGMSALMRAAGQGDDPAALEAARILLEAGADPSAAGPRGRTPLHMAATSDGEEMASLLLEFGADWTARSGRVAWRRRTRGCAARREWRRGSRRSGRART